MSSNVSAVLGLGTDFPYKDRTYRVSPWEYLVQGEYEVYLQGKAYEAQRKNARWKSPDEIAADRQQLDRDVTAGLYSFQGDEVARSIRHPAHLAHLFLLMLRGKHPEVTPALAREMVDADLGAVFDAINRANADPSTAPAGEKTPDSPA